MTNKTVLKREFNRSDVQRMRNIISKKSNDATKIQSGYHKKNHFRMEGDSWEESGKVWTIKNGIKQSVTKLDEYKKLVVLPISCPSCKGSMKINDLNKVAYSNYNVCFNCAIDIETEKKIIGTYKQDTILENKKEMIHKLEDMESALHDWYVSKNDNFVNEQGDIENWAGGDKDRIYKEALEQIAVIKNEVNS